MSTADALCEMLWYGRERFYHPKRLDPNPCCEREEREGGYDVGDGHPAREAGGREENHHVVDVGAGEEGERGERRAGQDEGRVRGCFVEGGWTGFFGERG